MDLNECTGEGMYFPSDECDDCDALIGRVASLEENKQDKLSAGENITIENNVISSTGGGKTYTAGHNIHIEDTVISAPNVYNKTEVDELLRDVSSIHMEVVTTLPTTGQSNVIYLLDDGLGNYEQWVYTETDGWIDLGGEEVDLSNYYNKTQTDALLADKQNKLIAGTNVSITGNTISAIDTKYTAGTNISISGTNVISAPNVYTKTETDDLLDDKQNKLTAGTNVTISGNTISATDTTYTAGTNISISGTVISAPNVYTKTETDTLLNAKQNTLTAGDNITISGNTISAEKTTIWQSQHAISGTTRLVNTSNVITKIADYPGTMPPAGKYTVTAIGEVRFATNDGGGLIMALYYGDTQLAAVTISSQKMVRTTVLCVPYCLTAVSTINGSGKYNLRYVSSNLVTTNPSTVETKSNKISVIGVPS